jgi:hypothetical protein
MKFAIFLNILRKNYNTKISKMKNILKLITRLTANIDFFFETIVKYSIIFAIITAMFTVIINNIAFQWYLETHYMGYFIIFISYLIIFTEIFTFLYVPLVLLAYLSILYYQQKKAEKLDLEEQIKIIDLAIEKNKIVAISAQKLSEIVMLPKENVARIMNLKVVQKEAEITISENFIIIYKLMPDIREMASRIAKRIFDGN